MVGGCLVIPDSVEIPPMEISREEIQAATERGRILDATEPRAVAARYDLESDSVVMELRTGVVVWVPRGLFPTLKDAAREDLAYVEVVPGGDALAWYRLDEHYFVPGILARALGVSAPVVASQPVINPGERGAAARTGSARLKGLRDGRPRKAAASASGS